MKEQKKFGFFKKMFLAITDFRLFPYILKAEKLSKSFAYFITFLLLLTTIISIYYTGILFTKIDEFIVNYNEIVPEFTLSDGVLAVDENQVVEIQKDVAVVIDTSYTYENYKDSENYNENTRYDARIFINSDAITYENFDGTGLQILVENVGEDYNKASFIIYLIKAYENPLNKLILFGVIFVSVLCGYTLIKFLEIILIALIVSLLCVILGIKIDTKNHFKIAIYVMTLPYIIELISILFTGTIKEYAAIATILLAYVYIFYAIRAVKLDAFLIMVNGKKKQKEIQLKVDEDENEINNKPKEDEIMDEEQKDLEVQENKQEESKTQENEPKNHE